MRAVYSSHFTKGVWKMGIRAGSDEKGIVRQEEIVRCVKQLMEAKRREQVLKHGKDWVERQLMLEGHQIKILRSLFPQLFDCTSKFEFHLVIQLPPRNS